MSNSETSLGLLGAGGQADEIESYAGMRVSFRAVDGEFVHGDLVDIANPTPDQLNTPVIAAVGAPAVKFAMVEKWRGDQYAQAVSHDAIVAEGALLGTGSVIAPGAIIMTNVEIGRHALVNIGATVSHNAIVGDYVTISPGVKIGGHVSIGDGAFIGIGATIINGVSIAKGVVVGAGAVVISDIIEENSVFAGVPARKISQNEGWLREI